MTHTSGVIQQNSVFVQTFADTHSLNGHKAAFMWVKRGHWMVFSDHRDAEGFRDEEEPRRPF